MSARFSWNQRNTGGHRPPLQWIGRICFSCGGTILLLKRQFKLTIEEIQHALEQHRYICDRSLATVVYLSMVMGKPVLLEGEAGVGKTEVAKVLAEVLDTRLIRLQCYEGLDVNTALYEWNYPKQMLRIKIEEGSVLSTEEKEHLIF